MSWDLLNWAFGLFTLLLWIPYLQDLIKVTQFMVGKATKSNSLLLPASALLIMFVSTGNIALHFGEVGRGSLRCTGGPFLSPFAYFFFLKRKSQQLLYGFLLSGQVGTLGEEWARSCCLKLVYRWGEPQGISCLLFPLSKQKNRSDETGQVFLCYSSLLLEMSFHVIPWN